MFKIVSFAAVSMLAVACAASNDESPEGAADEAVSSSAATVYSCHGGSDDSQLAQLEVTVTAKKLTVTDLSSDALPPDSGDVDPSYHPSSATYADTTRFIGYGSLTSGDVSDIAFMASKELMAGKASGKLFMRSSGGEGGGTDTYSCTSKPAAVKVDLSTKSRLNCSLQLVCTNDNPPGQTCLNTAFIQQTDPKTAKAKVSYMDHFGVHVENRTVDLGSAATLKRTAKSFAIDIDGNNIDLTYRAGITYTGSITMKGGQKATMQCNDLAMLDD